jgi:hypothetical protein
MTLHTAVIDAGSSGTRLFLYRVEPGPFARVEKLLEKEFPTMASGAKEDGINNFVLPDDPAAEATVVPEIIDPLLEHASGFLGRLGVAPAQVEVNLLATAGMRYAVLHGRPAIDRLYATIRSGVGRHGFPVGEVRTTCGSEEEGVWTWINLNDLLVRAFDGDGEAVGVVEVGGSSLQLTFPTDEDPDAVAHVHRVELAGRRFAVSCRSFLGLGQDDARKEMRRRLGPEGSAVCFPGGFRAAADHGDMLDGVGMHRLAADGCYDVPACSAAYGDIVQDRLATAGIPDLTHARGDFVGIDGVYYATEPWGIHEDPERLADLIPERCSSAANFPQIDERERVQAQAANATYINVLLTRLFHGSGRKLVRAVPTRRDGETLLTWTRGYLIRRYSRTPTPGVSTADVGR